MPEVFSAMEGEGSLHVFRLFDFCGIGQICTVLFTACLHLGVDSVPKVAITPLGPKLKNRFQLILCFQIQGLNLMKMGTFSLVVTLEDSDVGK